MGKEVVVVAQGVKEVVELFPKAMEAGDTVIAEKINPKSTNEKIKDTISTIDEAVELAHKGLPNACGEIDKTAAVVIEILGKELADKVKKEIHKTHGSKVKVGKYSQCRILYAGNKSCIVVDKEKGDKILYLTPQNVKSCVFVEKKIKPHKFAKDYYYEITFVDGEESFVRVSKRNSENLKKLMEQLETLE